MRPFPIGQLRPDAPTDGSVTFRASVDLDTEQALALELARKTLGITRNDAIRQAIALWLDDVVRATEVIDIARAGGGKLGA